MRTAFLNLRHRIVGVDVARAGAVPKFGGRIKRGDWLREFLVRLWSESIRVARGTIRLKGREFPNDRLRIRLVASSARDRRSVVWIKRRTMPVDYQCPRRRSVTGVARKR